MPIRGDKDRRCDAIARGLAAFRAAAAVNRMTVGRREVVDRCLREAGLSGLTDSEAGAFDIEQRQTPASLKAQWERNAPNGAGVFLQDEFGGDYESFAAYRKHDAAGHVTIFRGRS